MRKLQISDSLALPLEAVTQTFAILAKRGVGKTYTGCVLVEEMLAAKQQVVVVDPIGVWWGLRSKADGRSAGFAIVVFGGEHADVPLDENAGEVIAGAIIEHGFSAILDLSLLRKAAQVRFMTAFAETLYRLNRKPLHLAVDEADAFAPQRPLPGEQRLLGAFEDIVRRGRARGLGVTLITQRAAVLNKNVLTQIEVLVVLRTISPQDREAIESWTEIHGTKKQLEQLSESMASLPIGNAWFWSPGWLDIFQRVQVRQRLTFDSSATPKVGEQVIAPKELAAVDLDQLGAQIKSTAAKAKENDPGELKRTIATLRKEISVLQKAAPAVREKIKEVPALTKEEKQLLKTIGRSADDLSAALNRLHDAALNLAGFESQLRKLTTEKFWPPDQTIRIKTLRPGERVSLGTLPLAPRPVVAATRQSAANLRSPRYPVATVPTAKPPAEGERKFGKAERALLTAAIQRHPKHSSRAQLGVLARYSTNSSTFDNALGALRTGGLLEGTGDDNWPTAAGLQMLPEVPPLPTGDELVRHWLGQLGKAERTLLEVIVQNPAGLDKEALGEIARYSTGSSTFDNAVGRLRTLELVTRGWPVRPAEELQ